ncbi:MAG: hypothetical protein WD749_07050 [Phycisphaerales bacterium]
MRPGAPLRCPLILACLLALCGCAAQKVSDPLTDLRDPRLSERDRERAIRACWKQAEAGEIDRALVRDELKTMAWAGGWSPRLRLVAIRTLLGDTTPGADRDNRDFTRLKLPREPERRIVEALSSAAAERGWSETTPALVRSLSRHWPGIPERTRPEHAALRALNPGRTVEQVVYDTFLHPPEEDAPVAVGGLRGVERVRVDAWDLLGRLDTEGTARAAMLLDRQAPPTGPVADMRAALLELRTLPVTGEELRWLVSMRDFNDPAKAAWWKQASIAVSGLDPVRGGRLGLRHLEPIRWASLHRPEWIRAPRGELLHELRSRLEGRQLVRRRASAEERWRPSPEGLRDWEARLTWADLLTILVIDEGLRDPAVVAALLAQAEMDRADTTAEYGGVLRAGDTAAESAGSAAAPVPPWRAIVYPPRPGNRRGDREFVASADMIAQGDHSAAHYHFHAQDERNADYAGPSPGDLAYAARLGRTCLVLTSVEKDALNADLYQPDGVVLDLGTLRKPPAAAAGR